MNLAALHARLQEDGSDAASAGVADDLRREAAASPTGFLAFLAALPIDADCMLFEVYEALFDDAETHSHVLLHELDRLLARAARTPRDPWVYRQLEAFTYGSGNVLRDAIAARLVAAVQSPVPGVRRFAAELGGDLLPTGDGTLEALLAAAAVVDDDWRVRLLASDSLGDASLPVPPPSFGDRVRRAVWSGKARQFTA